MCIVRAHLGFTESLNLNLPSAGIMCALLHLASAANILLCYRSNLKIHTRSEVCQLSYIPRLLDS